ncbi:hypothetical protein M3610_24825 [Neobacillus sp. MER 74]|uniref:hypothetical protein n=1 Tax=Neobacillus sp. MER 74 TaxID=2939566 RepID=UPI00203EFCE4|nr:hypothetical protein [Neobacillus sp. MER 74]MCM3118437.1 hypothetical protein [Neobacillus sp. MER 74]
MYVDNSEQFIKTMHALVRNGKRYFVKRNRKGVSYIQQLADLGLYSVEEAWVCLFILP